MATVNVRRPSPLQRSILIVLAALGEQYPDTHVPTRLIERLLTDGGYGPVYGPNLRASCRRMETVGLLRILRAASQQLAVELTESGRSVAAELLAEERARGLAERRAAEVVVLSSRDALPAAETATVVTLNGTDYQAVRGDYVIRLDGRTCLQLTNHRGVILCIEGDALAVCGWYQLCQAAGLPGHVQINEGQASVVASPENDRPLTEREEQKAMNALLDRLARWHIHCNRDSLEALMFSPSRSPYESWQQRLQWLAIGKSASLFGFYSGCSREDALPALMYLEETFGRASAEDFAEAIRWPAQEK